MYYLAQFVNFRFYKFYLSDVVIVQTVVRCSKWKFYVFVS